MDRTRRPRANDRARPGYGHSRRRPAIWGALAVAALGLPLLLSSHLAAVVTGMVLVGVGTFFAQAATTSFAGRAALDNRGVASGTYLACYFLGGLVGNAVLGQLFDRFGWTACNCRCRHSPAHRRHAGDAAQASTRIQLKSPSARSRFRGSPAIRG